MTDPLAFLHKPRYSLSFLEEQELEEEVCDEEEEEEKEKEEEAEELLLLRPVRPLLSRPPYGYPDEDGVPRSEFVLIEQKGYFVDRDIDNATSASCDTRAPLKGKIKVTFCTVPPPMVSYYCVHATAYDHTDFVTEPLILVSETDGGLLLLCLIIGNSRSDFFRCSCRHFFVYDAGTSRRRPSLKHIPHPGATLEFDGSSLAIVRQCSNKGERRNPARKDDNSATVDDNYCGPTLRPRHKLRPPRSLSSSPDHQHPHTAISSSTLHPHAGSTHDCSDCAYAIVAKDCDFACESPSFLWIYQSKTEEWSAKPVYVPTAHRGHNTSKTFTIGEEVAWVDLSRNIIFCDVMAETPKCRVVSLPMSVEKLADPRTVRDIAILNDSISYVELSHEINKDDKVDSWSAAKWSKRISSLEGWHLDHKICSSKIEINAYMPQPDLRRVFVGLPNLSLQDEDVVYCLAKIQYWDSEKTAWVVAIDLRNNAIQQVVDYNATKTVGLSIGYSASRISKYLREAETRRLTLGEVSQ